MKRLLLWAVVLLCVSLSAQEKGRVGINIEDPTAALDVNGTTRIRDIQLCNECTWVLVIDGEGNVRKRPLGTGGGVKYYKSFTTSETRQFKSKRCGPGKAGVPHDVVSDDVTGEGYSSESEADALNLAKGDAQNKLDQWFADNGQRKANEANECVDRDPRIQGYLCERDDREKKYALYYVSNYYDAGGADARRDSDGRPDEPNVLVCGQGYTNYDDAPRLPVNAVLSGRTHRPIWLRCEVGVWTYSWTELDFDTLVECD